MLQISEVMSQNWRSYNLSDTSLFTGTFRYFGPEPVMVRGKAHTEQERYRKSDVNLEIAPIGITQGERTYVHLKPFVLIPDITLTIGLYPQAAPSGAIGEVIGAQEKRQKEVELGNAQAWYYPDGTLVLWEAFLHEFCRDAPLPVDANMRALWESLERFLVQQFPQASRIVTTSHDPIFDTDEYQAFLRQLRYEQVAQAAYGKSIEQS
jgi:hypothetical protein